MAADPERKRPGLPAVTEADLLAAVIELALLRGWAVHHCRPARTSKGWRTPIKGTPGFVDLVLARDGRLLFVELKSARGKLSAGQEEWIKALRLHGDLVFVWQPADWDEIERTLM